MKVKKLCACGCCKPVKEGRKYAKSSHSMRGKKHSFKTRMQMSENSPKYWLGKKKKPLTDKQKKRQADSISLSLKGIPIKFDILRKLRRSEASAKNEGLGFIPLNTPFRGCVRHNIDHNAVIFMDASVHAHYKHSLKKPKSMVLINSIAISYMDNETDYEYLVDSMSKWNK
jgi:hypothetical protein